MSQIPSHQKDEFGFIVHHVGNGVISFFAAALAIYFAVALAAPDWLPTVVAFYKWGGAAILLVFALLALVFVAASVDNLRKGRERIRKEYEEWNR